ncbi:hypothetical protein [Streptomyces sp. SID5770]|nr:hypothetical protein [Streptomyces sp. SID5770]
MIFANEDGVSFVLFPDEPVTVSQDEDGLVVVLPFDYEVLEDSDG